MSNFFDLSFDQDVYYHGTTTKAGITCKLLPPDQTETISEKGRKKNLDRIFFTKDLGLARIYAGRAARSIGGDPVLLRVVNPQDVKCLNSTTGATVYHAKSAFCEVLHS